MTTPSAALPSSAFPSDGIAESPQTTTHFYVAVAWITYWLTNMSVLLADFVPFLSYYVMVVFFLMYYALMRPLQVLRFATNPLIWIWSISVLVPALIYFGGDTTPGALATVKGRVSYFSCLASVALVVWDRDGFRALQTAARISLGIAVTMCLGELFITNPYATAIGRSAGLYGDPNAAAAALAVLLLLSVDFQKQTPMSLAVVGVTLLAIFATLSRAGILFGVLLGGLYLFVPQGRETLGAGARMAIAIVGVFLALLVAVLAPFLVDTSQAWRVTTLFTGEVTDTSATGRVDRFFFTLEKFLEYFWTGRGPGSTEYYGVSAHNTFLTVGYEYGVFGLLFYGLLVAHGFVITLRNGWRRAGIFAVLAFALVYFGMFSHTVHQRSYLTVVFVVFMTKAYLKPPGPRRTPAWQQAEALGAA